MPKYEYCSVVFNFTHGFVEASYMKPDGNHTDANLWTGTALTDEQTIIRHQVFAQLGEDGWMLCSTLNPSAYYFVRQVEQSVQGTKPASEGDRLELDRDGYRLQIGDQTLELSSTESRLMAYFIGNPNRVLAPSTLLENVWEYPPNTGDPDLVRAHIRNLNTKVQRVKGNDYKIIRTVHGVGWMLVN